MALALHTDGTRLDCVQPATFPESGRSDHWNFGKMNGCFRPQADPHTICFMPSASFPLPDTSGRDRVT